MIRSSMRVKVYDGDFIGWTFGHLVKYLGNDRWTIFTDEKYCLDRRIIENYKDEEVKPNGCGYVIESAHCPYCGSYEISDEDGKGSEIVCYECDTYFKGNGEIIRTGNMKRVDG